MVHTFPSNIDQNSIALFKSSGSDIRTNKKSSKLRSAINYLKSTFSKRIDSEKFFTSDELNLLSLPNYLQFLDIIISNNQEIEDIPLQSCSNETLIALYKCYIGDFDCTTDMKKKLSQIENFELIVNIRLKLYGYDLPFDLHPDILHLIDILKHYTDILLYIKDKYEEIMDNDIALYVFEKNIDDSHIYELYEHIDIINTLFPSEVVFLLDIFTSY